MSQSAMLNNLAGAEIEEVSGRQYLTFLLAQEQYALDILQVQEIRGWEQVTRVPNSPAYVRGVINLRGTIVPVIDLRLRFGLDAQEYGKETVVIVVRALLGNDVERSLGLVVDAVSDVMMARDEDVVATPEFGAEVRTENITGLVSLNGQMVMVLDIPGLFEVGGDSSG